MRFEVAPEAERRWRRAAASEHLPLQDWLRAVADDAVPAGPGDVQDGRQVGGDAEGGQVAAGGPAVALDPVGGKTGLNA